MNVDIEIHIKTALHILSFSKDSMRININSIQRTTSIPECIKMHKLQQAMFQDDHEQCLKEYIIKGWPESKDQIPQDMRTYWTYPGDMAVCDGVILKQMCIEKLEVLQKQELQQFHSHLMGIEEINYNM